MHDFAFVQPPSRAALAAALEQLLALGALGRRGELTPLGRSMAALPLAPTHARALMAAPEHGCVPEVLSLLAILSVDGAIFFAPAAQREAAADAKRPFLSAQVTRTLRPNRTPAPNRNRNPHTPPPPRALTLTRTLT